MITKVYCYEDKLFSTIDEIVEILEFENEDEIVNSFPNGLEAFECNLQPVHQFTIDGIIDLMNETNSFDGCNDLYEETYDLLEKNINIDKINEEMPKVYVISSKKITFTTEELLNEFKKNKENEPF